MSKAAKYNGWKNYQTWNVVLWMDNDEKLYDIARKVTSYREFRAVIKDIYSVFHSDTLFYPIVFETPDGVAWSDSAICMAEIDRWFDGRQARCNYKARLKAVESNTLINESESE